MVVLCKTVLVVAMVEPAAVVAVAVTIVAGGHGLERFSASHATGSKMARSVARSVAGSIAPPSALGRRPRAATIGPAPPPE